ncbi:terminase family protein [Desulfovibrio sp. X2]|uniref:terminase large subunit domain-containing protein n=1 Tax=Desulfovibrio sp. X2 TaxID=941449 RepID=UPI000428BAAD|nr:terminase family protein [Desulfovibrio sp. X2]
MESCENQGSARARQYPEEIRTAARGLYLRRYTVAEISDALNVPRRTVYHWAASGEWDAMLTHESAEDAVARRLALLVEREPKTAQDLKELDLLVGSLERMQALRARELTLARKEPSGGEAGAHPDGEARSRGEQSGDGPRKQRAKKIKNDVSRITPAMFQEKFHTRFFDFQRGWRVAKAQRNRFILKSRQIGATWYFSQESFEDACLAGDNQIFLSATRAQSRVFRNYIVQLVGEAFDITLTGDPLVLHTANGPAELHFLSNNSKSAQSYHGHVYIDEAFWIMRFRELFKVATGMAAHKKWRRTLFSTPSAVTHEAYALWSGADYQKRFARPKPWPDAAAHRQGVLCPDTWWRQIVTLADAEKGGCDLFDAKQLRLEYTPEEFRQLFGCEFIDDTMAVFSLPLLEGCMADPADWDDVRPGDAHPVGNRPVWGGYDPSRTRDDASFTVALPPLKSGGKVRVIERHKWVGKSYLWQTERIRELCAKYRFAHLGIDTTGPGIGVYEQVKTFCPLAMPIVYSVQTKAALVLKALEVMEQGRLEWDAAETGIAHAFMCVRRVVTGNGQVTYAANRTAETGHADEAWSIMHALAAEPLARMTGTSGCTVAIGG